MPAADPPAEGPPPLFPDRPTHGGLLRLLGIVSPVPCDAPLRFLGCEFKFGVIGTEAGRRARPYPAPVHVCDACDQVVRLVEVPLTAHTAFRTDPVRAMRDVADLWTVDLFP